MVKNSSSLIPSLFSLCSLLLTLGSLISLAPRVCSAYEPLGVIWALGLDEAVPYTVNRSLSADVDDGPCLGAVRAGFESWSAVSCSYMMWRFDGRTDNQAWGAQDGENVVSWRESDWDDSAAALAITANVFDLRGMIDTDIKYNGFHHAWAIVNAGDARGVDVESVTAHEVGHALGLNHSDSPGATMWPSTGPNDSSASTLSSDDIEGICALYPSGAERPDVVDEPVSTVGAAGFGESCLDQGCEPPLFCVSDGIDQRCTQPCDPDRVCPSGYYCAQLSSGSGACAPGEPPARERVGFNEACGQAACEVGLLCVNAGEESYCSRACEAGLCPDDFSCAGLRGGGDICVRDSAVPLPTLGEPCAAGGQCAKGFFCLLDPLYTSAVSGEPIPYCSRPCDDGCPRTYRCATLAGDSDACQREPTTSERTFGDECWVNMEDPYAAPTCGDGLRCVNTRRDPNTQEVIEPGLCTSSCESSSCCPEGWGCSAVTPFLGICTEGVPDDEGFECMGERPSISSPEVNGGSASVGDLGDRAGEGGASEPSSSDETGECVQSRARPHTPSCIFNLLTLLCALIGFMIYRRALRAKSVQSS